METIDRTMFFQRTFIVTGNPPSIAGIFGRHAVSQIGRCLKRTARGEALALIAAALAALMGTAGPSASAQEGRAPRDLAAEGRRLMDAGDAAGAFASFAAARRALEGKPADRELIDYLGLGLYNLGVRLNNERRADEAIDCFIEALRLRRIEPGLRDADFRARLTDASLAVASYLVALNRTVAPIQTYRLLVEGPSPDARALAGLGAAHLARGELPEGLSAYDKAALIDPNLAEAAAGKGRALVQMAVHPAAGRAQSAAAVGLLQSAIESLGRAADLDPLSGLRQRDLAAALSRLGRELVRMGNGAGAAGREAQAEAAYRRAVDLEPESPWLRLDLATFLFTAERYEEAAALFAQVESALDALLEASPSAGDAGAWRKARDSCRENRAAAGYNRAVDAVNVADFDRADRLLAEGCGLSPTWEETCRSFRRAASARRDAFVRVVSSHEEALRIEPSSAADLLALGDLYAGVGDYDRSLAYYRKAQAAGVKEPGLADRIAGVIDPGELSERRKVIDVQGGKVDLIYFREDRVHDLETAVKASWLRVSTALGEDSLAGGLSVTLYPNRRTFRQKAGYRVGSLVKGHYGAGRVSLYETPSHGALEWVSVLTHEMTHHAVATLSGGAAPWWLSEGAARWVEGESSTVDRARLKRRLGSGALKPLEGLDDLMRRSWNDPEAFLDARDEALLAVETMAARARRRGSGGVRDVLRFLAGAADAPDPGAALERVLGITLPELERTWRSGL